MPVLFDENICKFVDNIIFHGFYILSFKTTKIIFLSPSLFLFPFLTGGHSGTFGAESPFTEFRLRKPFGNRTVGLIRLV